MHGADRVRASLPRHLVSFYGGLCRHENPNSPQASQLLSRPLRHPSAYRLVHENIQINSPQLNLQSFGETLAPGLCQPQKQL